MKFSIKDFFSKCDQSAGNWIFQTIEKSLPSVTSCNPVKGNVNKGIFRNFAKSTGKHLCQNLFFNKVAGLEQRLLLKPVFDNGKMPLGCLYLKVRSVPFHRLKQKHGVRWLFVQFVNIWWPTWSSFILVEWPWNTFSHQRTLNRRT